MIRVSTYQLIGIDALPVVVRVAPGNGTVDPRFGQILAASGYSVPQVSVDFAADKSLERPYGLSELSQPTAARKSARSPTSNTLGTVLYEGSLASARLPSVTYPWGMTVSQFRRWLESKIESLRGLQEWGNEDDHIDAQGLIDEAYEHAVDLQLPEAAAACKPGPVTIRLLEVLDALSESDVLTPPQVAQELGVSSDTVRGWIRSRRLKATNVAQPGKRPRWVIQRGDLQTFMEPQQPDKPRERIRSASRKFY